MSQSSGCVYVWLSNDLILPPVPSIDQVDREGDDVDLPAVLEVAENIGELRVGSQIACQVQRA